MEFKKLSNGLNISEAFHPPTQETTALAVEECVYGRYTISMINVSCFGGFRSQVGMVFGDHGLARGAPLEELFFT